MALYLCVSRLSSLVSRSSRPAAPSMALITRRTTPTVFVGKTGGDLRRVELATPSDLDALERAIAAAA